MGLLIQAWEEEQLEHLRIIGLDLVEILVELESEQKKRF